MCPRGVRTQQSWSTVVRTTLGKALLRLGLHCSPIWGEGGQTRGSPSFRRCFVTPTFFRGVALQSHRVV